mmetsp:Transcript_85809/g.228733  ORF Transcript_85809/g.228733 Transcript_85809/m.228733 type:complete len:220 (+) Transcript_85809:187-846(+)
MEAMTTRVQVAATGPATEKTRADTARVAAGPKTAKSTHPRAVHLRFTHPMSLLSYQMSGSAFLPPPSLLPSSLPPSSASASSWRYAPLVSAVAISRGTPRCGSFLPMPTLFAWWARTTWCGVFGVDAAVPFALSDDSGLRARAGSARDACTSWDAGEVAAAMVTAARTRAACPSSTLLSSLTTLSHFSMRRMLTARPRAAAFCPPEACSRTCFATQARR